MTDDTVPFRGCDLCGAVDRDPRHSFSGTIADVHPVDPTVRPALDTALEALVADGSLSVSQAVKIGADYQDTASTDRHIDCCASAGCPLVGTDKDADACDHRVTAARGATGQGMRDAALSLKPQEQS